MRSVYLTSIHIPAERQRQAFDLTAMQELRNSIEDVGLMHPPVLRQGESGWVLVAGERRLRAIQEIWALGGRFRCDGDVYSAEKGAVPFINLGDLDPLAAEEAELDENLRRCDLTWQEHAAAVARLHALRTAQAAAAAKPTHTVADTAREVTGRSDGYFQDSTRKEIIVASHLSNPEVAKAKTADEAFKILKRQEQTRQNIALAEEVGKTFTADVHELLNTNCLVYMRDLVAGVGLADGGADKLFDVILTDPPYGMGADKFGDGGGQFTNIQHDYEDSYEYWQTLMQQFIPLTFQVTKPQAHAYIMCDIDRFHELKRWMADAGWTVFRTPLIAHKINSGRVPLPEHGPRRQYECVLYAFKGNKPVTHIYPDVISTQGDENLSHGAQKPVALYQNLLQRSCRPGDRVYDAFAGTGTIFPAAHSLRLVAVGTEYNQAYYGIALKRLAQVKLIDTPLPALL